MTALKRRPHSCALVPEERVPPHIEIRKELDVSKSARVATTARQPDEGLALRPKAGAAGAAVAASENVSAPWCEPSARTRSFHATSVSWCSLHAAWRRRLCRRLKLPSPLPKSDRHRQPLYAAQNKQTPKPQPACPSHVSFFKVTGFVTEQRTLHFTLCFQKRQGPHVLTCIGKLWLAACSSRVWEASTSKVSTTLLGATDAVAADPGLLPLPSSEDCVEPSPDELLPEPSDSDTAARGDAFAVAAGSGLLPRPSSSLSPAAEAAELLAEASGFDAPSLDAVAGVSGPSSDSLAAPSADSSADAAADVLAEPSGSDTASHEDAFSDSVAATEELALGEGLAATLEDIAAGPRRGASGARRSSPKEGYGGG